MRVAVENFENFPYNDKEIYRYMGLKEKENGIINLVSKCKEECKDAFDFKVCYAFFRIEIKGDTVDFGEFSVKSESLAKNLIGSKNAVVFVCTVGFLIDKYIKKYSSVTPSKSVIFSAIGSERVETFCDCFCNSLKEKYGENVGARFSAGYGDLSLEFQKIIFENLNATKNIGVTLNDSLLMSPTKSVSAVVGLGGVSDEKEDCCDCNKTDCTFRK